MEDEDWSPYSLGAAQGVVGAMGCCHMLCASGAVVAVAVAGSQGCIPCK
jgi:hypothetical protein